MKFIGEGSRKRPCVYKVGCLGSDVVYIGAAKDAGIRFVNHKSELKHKKHFKKEIQTLCNSFGLESMFFEVLEYCAVDELPEREQFYFELFRKYCCNKRPSVLLNTGLAHSEETKKKIGEKSKGRIKSPETIEKMRIARTGMKLSDAAKKKISLASIGNKKGVGHIVSEEAKALISKATSRTVKQYDLDGNFIKEWPSSRAAAESLGISFKNIPTVINGKRNQAGGFKWTR